MGSHESASCGQFTVANLLGQDAVDKILDALQTGRAQGMKLTVRLDARICILNEDDKAQSTPLDRSVPLGFLDIDDLIVPKAVDSNSSVEHHVHAKNDVQRPSDMPDERRSRKRHKAVGGLRLYRPTLAVEIENLQNFETGLRSPEETEASSASITPTRTDTHPSESRRLQASVNGIPQRKKRLTDAQKAEPLSMEKFIAGIWKQLYGSVQLTPSQSDMSSPRLARVNVMDSAAFLAINKLCSQASTMGKAVRATEVIVQTHWVDCFEKRIAAIKLEKPQHSNMEAKVATLKEATTVLQCSNKELQNKLRIWRGYQELKNASGWVTLIFAGSGLYRYCKYRTTSLTVNLIAGLRKLQHSFEVAADTLHPRWRELLEVIGIQESCKWSGHPHDWVVCEGHLPVTLRSTYEHLGSDFKFEHISDSQIDREKWGTIDPRRRTDLVGDVHFCGNCGNVQSDVALDNRCQCFPEIFGGAKHGVAVQVFRAGTKNNGLVARSALDRGTAIGEFVGLITKDMANLDVMQGGIRDRQYQIYQGSIGNYTRFVNHSCAPNSQFQKFSWLGLERIILVSRGISLGTEITVDYSQNYWHDLDKICLCGEACCRYSSRRRKKT